MQAQSSSVAVIGVGIGGSTIARNLIAVDALRFRYDEAGVAVVHAGLDRDRR